LSLWGWLGLWALLWVSIRHIRSFVGHLVITPGYIKELDDEGRLLEDEYPYYGATEEERDGMGEMCDPYEGL